MFEKFTQDARMAVVEAQIQARQANAGEIDTPHLLAGIAKIEQGDGARLLGELGISLGDIDAELDRIRRRGGVSDADVEALTDLGIDVERIVE
ncbi:MAG TPA: Clp protease N-terminal domain-containing protein, partial [Amycolatopsis sp.]|nr:Clp protease N-terminal domain-containing protein [Amycolatopsis sp.]